MTMSLTDSRNVGALETAEACGPEAVGASSLPQAMAEIIRDPNKSSRAKTSAARVLATLHGQNHAHTASALTVHHRVEKGKPLWPVRPAAGEDGGEGPVAFLEQASEQDLRATAKVLAELGILQ